jgi:hypothetical protein
MLTLAAISFAARVLTGKDIPWNKGDIWVVIGVRSLGVRPLRLLPGRERQDHRHGAVRRAGRDRRRHRCKRAPGGRSCARWRSR